MPRVSSHIQVRKNKSIRIHPYARKTREKHGDFIVANLGSYLLWRKKHEPKFEKYRRATERLQEQLKNQEKRIYRARYRLQKQNPHRQYEYNNFTEEQIQNMTEEDIEEYLRILRRSDILDDTIGDMDDFIPQDEEEFIEYDPEQTQYIDIPQHKSNKPQGIRIVLQEKHKKKDGILKKVAQVGGNLIGDITKDIIREKATRYIFGN